MVGLCCTVLGLLLVSLVVGFLEEWLSELVEVFHVKDAAQIRHRLCSVVQA